MEEFNNHHISPNLQSFSNHTHLLVSVIIEEEFIQERKQSIVRNSKKEKEFVNELRNSMSNVNMINILNCDTLEHVT